MRTILAAALLAALVLSGCSGGSDDSGDGGDGATTGPGGGTTSRPGGGPGPGPGPGGTGSGTTGPGPGPGPNQAPTGRIVASTEGGPIPLQVTFTLEGSDPDGDPLAWTLDANGDGSADAQGASPAQFPATYKHNYTAAGVFEATYQLTDGAETVSLSVTINATASSPPAYTFTASYTGVDPTADPTVHGLFYSCVAAENGVGGNWHTDLPETIGGWSYTIEPAGKGFYAYFYDEDINRLTNGGDTGTVPDGAWEVDICTGDPSAGGSYTFTAVPA